MTFSAEVIVETVSIRSGSMNVIQKVIVIFALGGIFPGASQALPDRAEVIQHAASLVKIQAFDDRNKTFFGTGVVVGPHRVATNCHVTRTSAQIVVLYRGESMQVSGQDADIDHDICLLDVPVLNAPPLALRDSGALRVGQPVWAMGFEGGAALQFRVGFVRALHKHDGAWVIESTTAFTSGSSGGALMDDEGHLVGLLTYRLRGDRRSYFCIPLDWLSRTTTARTALPEVLPMLSGLAFWQRPQESLPFFLRAHRLIAESDWQGLLALTDQWAAMEGTSAEAWWYRGAGLERVQDPRGAATAYEQALAREPEFIHALWNLGRVYAELGAMQDALRILTILSGINVELGSCLSDRITHRAQSPPNETSHEACSAL
jgi:serine protease Do